MTIGGGARTALAAIRIFNGALGLFAAPAMGRRVGADLEADRSFVYPARMFGIRTLIIGVDLLFARCERARRLLEQAVVIHATDTVAAAYAGKRGELGSEAAALTTAISAVNTGLAVTALARS